MFLINGLAINNGTNFELFFYVKILVFFDESLGIYVCSFRIYIFFYYYFTPQPATGLTKNRVRTIKVLEKKGRIFYFFFEYCSPVYFDSKSALIY